MKNDDRGVDGGQVPALQFRYPITRDLLLGAMRSILMIEKGFGNALRKIWT
jgi:hypothetical protein